MIRVRVWGGADYLSATIGLTAMVVMHASEKGEYYRSNCRLTSSASFSNLTALHVDHSGRISINLSARFFFFCFCAGENAIRDEDVLSAALYPKVFNDYMVFREEFGPVDGLPTRLFFTGPEIGEEFQVAIEPGKVLNIKVLAISDLHPNGQREVFCEMNGQLRTVLVEDKSVTKVLTALA